MIEPEQYEESFESIAIVGMSVRFPGADTVPVFWQNLCDGVESITEFTVDDLIKAGQDPAKVNKPNYVKSHPILNAIDYFDAEFFAILPSEAKLMDPQQRFFLENAWEALENAGYNPETYDGWIGVFCGVSPNSYMLENIWSNQQLLDEFGMLPVLIANDRDYLPTRVSYKLNLKGPSLNVQTACSTSLVATHLACQSLLQYQCDMTLVGGATIHIPHIAGYEYQEGGVQSPDGRCRPFDAQAQGTVFGNGVGVVVLKRLSDALADGDHIYATIRGSAINNDGAVKMGYTAPSIEGQATVIAMAQAAADVEPDSIEYVEAHGTGTQLGDPIEVQALTQAFQALTNKTQFCALGSIKSNIGHTDAAAGVAGLMKAALSLKYEQIPPNPNFETPNPQIDFDNSPFYVNKTGVAWSTNGKPRRAGVSSFGIGGTNAHVILEEAPSLPPSTKSRPWQLLLLSTRTSGALITATDNLLNDLQQHSNRCLADVAYTLQVGRKAFPHRRFILCRDVPEAIDVVATHRPKHTFTRVVNAHPPTVVFMFPGGGAQYLHMGADIYQQEVIFRHHIDECAAILQTKYGLNLHHLLYPDEGTPAQPLVNPSTALPALFAVEYALAQLWMAWGITPQAMIGHSMGEYVAACLAGVFSLADAISLVTIRGQLFEQLPLGSMLGVSLSEEEIRPFLDHNLAIAAVNSPTHCVVSGPVEAIEALATTLTARETEIRRLQINVAAHSEMVASIMTPFQQSIENMQLNAPQLPFISNVTGTWITPAEATSPHYWTQHLRQTVRFADGIQHLLHETNNILLEVGPGRTLSSLAKRQTTDHKRQLILPSMRHPQDEQSDVPFLLNTLGKLWATGVEIDWQTFYKDERRYRQPLPTYPFERQRYWIEPKTHQATELPSTLYRKADIADWFYISTWQGTTLPTRNAFSESQTWLLFADTQGIADAITVHLKQAQQRVIIVTAGQQFSQSDNDTFTIRPRETTDYVELLATIGLLPHRLLYLWGITPPLSQPPSHQPIAHHFDVLLQLVQLIEQADAPYPVQIDIVANQMQSVVQTEAIALNKAPLLGLSYVIPQEYPHISCRCIDIVLSGPLSATVNQLLAELTTSTTELAVAYRGPQRWVPSYMAVSLKATTPPLRALHEKGVYLLIGGFTEIGSAIATFLAQTLQATLVLVTTPRAMVESTNLTQKIEAMGSTVLVFEANTTDQAQMQAVITQTLDQFGHINGLIYTRNTTLDTLFVPIQEMQPWLDDSPLTTEHQTLSILQTILPDNIDFCLLNSSTSTILGGPGLARLSVTDHLLDAFAHNQNLTNNTPWLTVNWDMWYAEGEPDQQGSSLSLNKFALTTAEGTTAFHRIITTSPANKIVVSTNDLSTRVKQLKQRVSALSQSSLNQTTLVNQDRPELGSDYAPPENDIQWQVSEVWQRILGIDTIGIHDDFFDLGGNSLLVTQLVNHLQKTFAIQLPIKALFEHSTIAAVSELIAAQMAQTASHETVSITKQIQLAFPHERLPLLETYLQQNAAHLLNKQVSRLPIAAAWSQADWSQFIRLFTIKMPTEWAVSEEDMMAVSTVTSLAQLILDKLNYTTTVSHAAKTTSLHLLEQASGEQQLIDITNLSDEEVYAMLNDLLTEGEE